MFRPTDSSRLRRITGALFVVGAVAFGVAATVLSSTFEWPDIVREAAAVVLPSFVAGGSALEHARRPHHPLEEALTPPLQGYRHA